MKKKKKAASDGNTKVKLQCIQPYLPAPPRPPPGGVPSLHLKRETNMANMGLDRQLPTMVLEQISEKGIQHAICDGNQWASNRAYPVNLSQK